LTTFSGEETVGEELDRVGVRWLMAASEANDATAPPMGDCPS
jgi:hypothetical protein